MTASAEPASLDWQQVQYGLEQILWDCHQRLATNQLLAILSDPQQPRLALKFTDATEASQPLDLAAAAKESERLSLMPKAQQFKLSLEGEQGWQLELFAQLTAQSPLVAWQDSPSLEAIKRTLKQITAPKLQLSQEHSSDDLFTVLSSLQALTLYMNSEQTELELCELVVRTATQQLQIDRMAIFMIGPEPNRMRGTWGTNDQGQVVARTDYVDDIPSQHPMVSRALKQRDLVMVNPHATLFFNRQPVGLGWNAMVAIWAEGEAIGWIAADNLLQRRGFTLFTQETLKLLGAMTGSVISRIRSRQSLVQLNAKLEQRVQERTDALSQSLVQLQQTQDQLIQSEKLSALGGLVAGVAHEVNTPLGVAVTASSNLGEILSQLQQQFQQGQLTKTSFSELVSFAHDNNQLLFSNLKRAARLISDFKKTAVDQNTEAPCRFCLNESLDALVTSLHPETRKKGVQPHVDCPAKLYMHGRPGLISQVFTNLIMNSLIHAFDQQSEPCIRIQAQILPEQKAVQLSYQDNGAGIAPEQIERVFEPFYTTKRQTGGSGLGLSIVHNLVQQMGGRLQLSSQLGQGVHFDFQIPLQMPEPETARKT